MLNYNIFRDYKQYGLRDGGFAVNVNIKKKPTFLDGLYIGFTFT